MPPIGEGKEITRLTPEGARKALRKLWEERLKKLPPRRRIFYGLFFRPTGEVILVQANEKGKVPRGELLIIVEDRTEGGRYAVDPEAFIYTLVEVLEGGKSVKKINLWGIDPIKEKDPPERRVFLFRGATPEEMKKIEGGWKEGQPFEVGGETYTFKVVGPGEIEEIEEVMQSLTSPPGGSVGRPLPGGPERNY
jgi:hypothetical protein